MNDRQLLQYSRHIMLEELDIAGQEQFLNACVLVVGCGGLGSAAISYLVSAGVGKLIIADYDAIELSNLQRQIQYSYYDIGLDKVEVMTHTMHRRNPETKLMPIAKKLTLNELIELMPDCDLVLDCSDNFATRKAINQASVQTKTPLISGAATRFEGQLMVFDPREKTAPCYACLFDGKDASDGPCATFGVFSPLVGVIGAQQASEALKMIAKIGYSPTGVLYQYDALYLNHQQFQISKNTHCAVCASTHDA